MKYRIVRLNNGMYKVQQHDETLHSEWHDDYGDNTYFCIWRARGRIKRLKEWRDGDKVKEIVESD